MRGENPRKIQASTQVEMEMNLSTQKIKVAGGIDTIWADHGIQHRIILNDYGNNYEEDDDDDNGSVQCDEKDQLKDIQ